MRVEIISNVFVIVDNPRTKLGLVRAFESIDVSVDCGGWNASGVGEVNCFGGLIWVRV